MIIALHHGDKTYYIGQQFFVPTENPLNATSCHLPGNEVELFRFQKNFSRTKLIGFDKDDSVLVEVPLSGSIIEYGQPGPKSPPDVILDIDSVNKYRRDHGLEPLFNSIYATESNKVRSSICPHGIRKNQLCKTCQTDRFEYTLKTDESFYYQVAKVLPRCKSCSYPATIKSIMNVYNRQDDSPIEALCGQCRRVNIVDPTGINMTLDDSL